MISYNAIKQNSRLIQFEGTKQLVLRNSVPKVESVKKCCDESKQCCLFEF